jgi:hypothetical protein
METIIKAGNLVIPYGRITRADIHVKGEKNRSETLKGKKLLMQRENLSSLALLIHTFIWAIHFLS